MTDSTDLSKYEHIWTTEKQQWVLLADEESQREKDYMPYHIKSWRFLDVADAELRQAIVSKMLEAGQPIVTDEDVFGKQ